MNIMNEWRNKKDPEKGIQSSEEDIRCVYGDINIIKKRRLVVG